MGADALWKIASNDFVVNDDAVHNHARKQLRMQIGFSEARGDIGAHLVVARSKQPTVAFVLLRGFGISG